jgi:hypothetical protein
MSGERLKPGGAAVPPAEVLDLSGGLDPLAGWGATDSSELEPAASEEVEPLEATLAEQTVHEAEGVGPRRLYALQLAPLSAGERAHRALQAEEPELSAFCFEPDPQVLARLFENPRFGLAHARLVATWHVSATGLEALARRAALLRDPQVARRLLVNPQTGERVLARVLGARGLPELYRLCRDHEISERARLGARRELRLQFAQTGEPEERADVVVRTEGRVLAFLAGVPFDAKTAGLLASRTFSSPLLIEHLARFGPTPPVLLVRLLQQSLVRQQPRLRQIVLRHPNLPADLKRKG